MSNTNNFKDYQKCSVCNDTGVVKYKDLDEYAFRMWVPWKTQPCNNCNIAINCTQK